MSCIISVNFLLRGMDSAKNQEVFQLAFSELRNTAFGEKIRNFTFKYIQKNNSTNLKSKVSRYSISSGDRSEPIGNGGRSAAAASPLSQPVENVVAYYLEGQRRQPAH
jgi:hypothetical protein